MPFILQPSSLILIAVLVVLNAEAVLFVVLPVPNILVAADPLRRLFRAIFIELLFLRLWNTIPSPNKCCHAVHFSELSYRC